MAGQSDHCFQVGCGEARLFPSGSYPEDHRFKSGHPDDLEQISWWKQAFGATRTGHYPNDQSVGEDGSHCRDARRDEGEKREAPSCHRENVMPDVTPRRDGGHLSSCMEQLRPLRPALTGFDSRGRYERLAHARNVGAPSVACKSSEGPTDQALDTPGSSVPGRRNRLQVCARTWI